MGGIRPRPPGSPRVRYPGASPVRYPGRSPVRYPGASGVRYPGASPVRYPGASGVRYPGASPVRFPGASPVPSPGCSPVRYPGRIRGPTFPARSTYNWRSRIWNQTCRAAPSADGRKLSAIICQMRGRVENPCVPGIPPGAFPPRQSQSSLTNFVVAPARALTTV